MTKDWFTRGKASGAAAFARHWIVVLGLSAISIWIISSITGTTGPSLWNFVLIPPVIVAVVLLANLGGDRFRDASPQARRRVAVGGWLVAMALIIGNAALDLAKDTDVLLAAVFVVMMCALVYALWEFFPGPPPVDESHAAPRDDDGFGR